MLISEKMQSVLENSVDMVKQERRKLEIRTSGSEEDSSEGRDTEPYACPSKRDIVYFFSWFGCFRTADLGCDETFKFGYVLNVAAGVD